VISKVKGLITMTSHNPSGATRGPKVKSLDPSKAMLIIGAIIAFLRTIMSETQAKRITSAVLLAVGASDERVAELTGMSGRSVRELRKDLRDGDVDDNLFKVEGGGRKRKLEDVEAKIAEKIDSGEYRTHREIADMVRREFGLVVHRSTISRMLKKTESED
jgi:transposase